VASGQIDKLSLKSLPIREGDYLDFLNESTMEMKKY
jgi:hypothetical protein